MINLREEIYKTTKQFESVAQNCNDKTILSYDDYIGSLFYNNNITKLNEQLYQLRKSNIIYYQGLDSSVSFLSPIVILIKRFIRKIVFFVINPVITDIMQSKRMLENALETILDEQQHIRRWNAYCNSYIIKEQQTIKQLQEENADLLKRLNDIEKRLNK